MHINFWRLWQNTVIKCSIHRREPFFLFKIPRTKAHIIETKLIPLHYQPNYFSWGHRKQITSMRKIYLEGNIWRQYHIRVYKNGEVWGHDELSYEESAFGHLSNTLHKKTLYSKIPASEVAQLLNTLK